MANNGQITIPFDPLKLYALEASLAEKGGSLDSELYALIDGLYTKHVDKKARSVLDGYCEAIQGGKPKLKHPGA